jgi:uncharacterized protein YidB (DUF937 family)
MGLLDSVMGSALGALAGQTGQGGQAAGGADLMQLVGSLLGPNSPVGGLGGLLQAFQKGGLGDVAQSWVSTGQNLPVSPDQLSQVLGGDTLAKLGQQFGMSGSDLAGPLSQLLPQVVDQLTPGGQLPAAGAGGLGDLGNLAGMLGSLLGKR